MNKKGPQSLFCCQRSCCPEQCVLEACAHGPLWNGWNMEGFTGLFHTAFTKSTEGRVVEPGTAPESLWQGWTQAGTKEAWLWPCHSGPSHGTSQGSLCTHKQSLRQIFRCPVDKSLKQLPGACSGLDLGQKSAAHLSGHVEAKTSF